MDAASLRQSVINNNIANQNTPNFKRSEVRFEQFLKQEMAGGLTIEAKRTNPKHFAFQAAAVREPLVVQDKASVMNNNSNNVDIDVEMAKAAENQLVYGSLVRQTNYEISHLRTAIGGK